MSEPAAIDQSIPGTLTATSLELEPRLEIERWLQVMETLKLMSRSIQFWVGDAIAYGEENYGEEAWQALEQTDKTLANWSSVCRRVPRERRREDLSFSLHAEVAALEPAEQETWLERAAENAGEGRPMSVSKLRSAIREEQGKQAGATPGQPRTCPRCGGVGEIVD